MFKSAATTSSLPSHLLNHFVSNIASILYYFAVYGEHRGKQNLCNQSVGRPVDSHQVLFKEGRKKNLIHWGRVFKEGQKKTFFSLRESFFIIIIQGELAESGIVEILVQAVAQPQDEGYHGEFF